MMRETIDTTYADLRPTDLVIDKSGHAWPIAEEIETSLDGTSTIFWLCDPMTGIRLHNLTKPQADSVKVSRLPTQADEAAKLEADFPAESPVEALVAGMAMTTQSVEAGAARIRDEIGVTMAEAVAAADAWLGGTVEADFPKCPNCGSSGPAGIPCSWCAEAAEVAKRSGLLPPVSAYEAPENYPVPDSHVTMADAVAAVEEIGGTVEAEVTAEEVDAAAAATDDAPISLPPFADMTPLEQRSHLYLLHGLYGSDVTGKAELIAIHDQAHTQHDAGTLNSRHVPHVHTDDEVA